MGQACRHTPHTVLVFLCRFTNMKDCVRGALSIAQEPGYIWDFYALPWPGLVSSYQHYLRLMSSHLAEGRAVAAGRNHAPFRFCIETWPLLLHEAQKPA